MMNYAYPIASSGIGVMPKYRTLQKVVRTNCIMTRNGIKGTEALDEALADG